MAAKPPSGNQYTTAFGQNSPVATPLLWALLVVIFSEKAVLPVALWIPFAPPIDFSIPFDVTTAPMLFAASFAFGYLTAWLGIFLWDRVAEKSD
jgi:hypothetical protein